MILAIESSCDESAIALFDPERGLVDSLVHSQLDLHRAYGGVVPDLASREHLENFPALFERLRDTHGIEEITSVAVTRGPGLAGCLAVGIAAAKAASLLLGCPVSGVNHLTGHAFSPFLPIHAESPARFRDSLAGLLPHLGLLVSGGNTLLFRMDTDLVPRTLADTRDDAAGEALDKGAKLLGLPYPGGPEVERKAASGDPDAFRFPRAFADPADRAFSFSGVKTSLRYRLEKMTPEEIDAHLPDLCASYQEAVVDALIRKFSQVLKREKGVRSIGLSGGVANNRLLRERFHALADRFSLPGLMAEPEVTGDNAAMIAFAAFAEDRPVTVRKGDGLRFEPALRIGE